MQERIARYPATVFTVFLFALLSAACFARPPAPPDPRDAALLAKMTLAEKVNQLMLLSKGTMTGPDSAGRPNKSAEELAREGIGFQMSAFEWSAADINRIQRIALTESRLGIPVVFATDIVHGYWTVFPVPLGMASTFDPEDVRVMARISGLEGYSHGQRWTFAPMVDHPVDPRWGRVVETFGESPLVSSDYAVAAIEGFHRALAHLPGAPAPADFGIASCLKHYVGYGASQAGKDYAYVDLSERAIRQFHLPPFVAGVAAGAPSVMPAFTTGTGGVPMSANKHLLQDVLRGELGFDGVLVSDYAAMTELRSHGTAADDLDAAVLSLRDGTMTVDMEDGVYYAQLARAVETGRVKVADIDREVLRALAFKRKLDLFARPYVPEDLEKRVRVSAEHRSAAREIARKSIVLLRNETGLLPIGKTGRILVTGPLADAPADMLGPWHARGRAEDAISVLAGIRARAGQNVAFEEGVSLDAQGNGPKGDGVAGDDARIAKAVAAARGSDLVIAVIGERETQSGEAKNRAHLDLPGRQAELIDALLATRKPVVVVLITGRALAVPALFEKSGTLIHAFFPGTEAGHAVADVLFGDYNPGGKMPMTWPRSVGQVPIHHYDPPNGRPNIPERGDYKAHWLDESDAPLVPFGYGLSYSRFALEALEVPARAGVDGLVVRLRVRNLGARDGDEVPQLYLRPKVASTVTGKRLAAYRRVHVPAGKSVPVEFRIPAAQLTVLDRENRWTSASGTWEVTVGTDSVSGLAATFIAN